MALEFSAPAGLELIAQMQEQLHRAGQEMGLTGELAESMLAAGVAAWAAMALAGGQEMIVSLARVAGGTRLALACRLPGDGVPAGLAAPLFCPPGKSAESRRQGGRVIFQVHWEG